MFQNNRLLSLGINHQDIDLLMQTLIADLNETGHRTMACCQGRRTADEFIQISGKQRKHMPEAYIAFWEPLPQQIQKSLIFLGVNVYGDGKCINTIWVTSKKGIPDTVTGYYPVAPNKYTEIATWSNESIQLLCRLNSSFEEKVRLAIFG